MALLISGAFCLHAAPTLTLTGVSYYTLPLFKDDGSPYPTTQWTAGGPSTPAAVLCNSRVQANVTFAVSGADAAYTIKFWGESSTRAFTNVTFLLDAGVIAKTQATMTTSLTPNYVGFADPWTVNWKYTINGGATQSMGTSTIPTYLLLAHPIADVTLYHTVVHHACATTGATSQSQAVANSWGRFSGKAAKTWDGQTLWYYQTNVAYAAGRTYLEELLIYKNAQCEAWAALFQAVLGANGIASEMVLVSASAPADEKMIIKDWTQNNAGTGSAPYKWYMLSHASPFSLVPSYNGANYGDLSSSSTLVGQGTSPNAAAEKVFGVHYIVKWPVGSSYTYYDPSYGQTYSGTSLSAAESDFDSKAVYGYGTGFSIKNSTWEECWVRVNTTSNDISFSQ